MFPQDATTFLFRLYCSGSCSLTSPLFTFQDNPRSVAIKAVAKANDLELKISEVEFGNADAEHLKANGLGKIPAFVGEDGFALSECIAVAIYGKQTPGT